MAVNEAQLAGAGAQTQPQTKAPRRKIRWGAIVVNVVLAILCILWTVPTLGLLVSSFRTRDDINSTGWWKIIPHPEYVNVGQINLELERNPDKTVPQRISERLSRPVVVDGTSVMVTDAQLTEGYRLPDGRLIKWASRFAGTVNVQSQQVVSSGSLTTDNYNTVLNNPQYDMAGAFLSTFVVAIPATVIPILIAAFAAYAFAWMTFRGRKFMFGLVVALLVVPLQVALIPILSDYTALGINGTYLAVWLAHSGFGLALATYLLYNYISQLPRDIIESAFIDGATPFTTFTRLILPLSVPALASFAIFQFLWVWNDYLVALIFLSGGTDPTQQVLTMRLANLAGTFGENRHLLMAGAFISMIVPLLVFFGLQRYFVRGLLAGSVKG